ncbi:MAG: SIS domain-containing protein [Patescibacteria group bacterium]
MKDNLDSLGIGKALELFPEQIKTTFEQAMASNIEKLEFDSVIISGMGGSSNAGKIIQGLVESENKIQMVIYNDYGLPGWVNEKTLVVANSYSGNTEETLSGYEEAKKIGAKVIGISTGGKINDVIINPGLTNPSGFPKSGLGISFGALFGVLTKFGLLNYSKDDLYKSLDELVEIRKTWNAKETAQWLNGYLPVLFSGRPFLGALNAGRNAMCEISRNLTQFYDFPEVDHVLIEATQKPDLASKIRFVFFESQFIHPRIKTRFDITKKIFEKQGLRTTSYILHATTILGQSLELSHYCAWVGYHLSLLQNTDPGPEPWILELKNGLSQPVH